MVLIHFPPVSNANNDNLINVNYVHKIGQYSAKNFKSVFRTGSLKLRNKSDIFIDSIKWSFFSVALRWIGRCQWNNMLILMILLLV